MDVSRVRSSLALAQGSLRFARLLSLCPILALVVLAFLPGSAAASVTVYRSEDRTLDIGLRLQPRLEFGWAPVADGSVEAQRDFYIRRTRLRLTARMPGVSGFLEWRADNVDQVGTSPLTGVESVWIDHALGSAVQLRAGQFDQPFSRDRLTSYARQMAVDRGTVSDVPGVLGLTDKAIGLELKGRVRGGRTEYALGVFDNRMISGTLQQLPMFVGRLDLNLGSTADVFQDAHFGPGRWCSFAVNGSHQGSIGDASSARDSSQSAVGADAMVDVPLAGGRLLVRGEVSALRTDLLASSQTHHATLSMIGAAFLMWGERLQPFIRFDRQRGDAWLRGGRQDVTLLGANLYQRGHSLKLQADVRLQAGTEAPVDAMRLQAQIDF